MCGEAGQIIGITLEGDGLRCLIKTELVKIGCVWQIIAQHGHEGNEISVCSHGPEIVHLFFKFFCTVFKLLGFLRIYSGGLYLLIQRCCLEVEGDTPCRIQEKGEESG